MQRTKWRYFLHNRTKTDLFNFSKTRLHTFALLYSRSVRIRRLNSCWFFSKDHRTRCCWTRPSWSAFAFWPWQWALCAPCLWTGCPRPRWCRHYRTRTTTTTMKPPTWSARRPCRLHHRCRRLLRCNPGSLWSCLSTLRTASATTMSGFSTGTSQTRETVKYTSTRKR